MSFEIIFKGIHERLPHPTCPTPIPLPSPNQMLLKQKAVKRRIMQGHFRFPVSWSTWEEPPPSWNAKPRDPGTPITTKMRPQQATTLARMLGSVIWITLRHHQHPLHAWSNPWSGYSFVSLGKPNRATKLASDPQKLIRALLRISLITLVMPGRVLPGFWDFLP